MPSPTITNPSKGAAFRRRRVDRGWADPTKTPVEHRQCPGCATILGPRSKSDICQSCRAALKNDGPDHGTTSRYLEGCRCDPCRDANSRYYSEYRKRKRANA